MRVNLRSVVVDRARALATTTSMGCRSTDTRSSQNDVSIVITEYYPLGTIVQRFVFSNKRNRVLLSSRPGPESRARPRSESKARQIGIKNNFGIRIGFYLVRDRDVITSAAAIGV
ncbi:hypothetical protein EVAR_44117_1 [Eumeta japonica]|uniref:Uncharacterized protein n=1 Tax=Eumeta variegata TaxID=151549 RepID=A0A4C2A3C4_EUMVA|nr:hypothetical protein EVAR_44117_1 [Eumeta japonica]